MTVRRALIGFTGFVGQNLLQQLRFDAKFNSKNIEQLRGQTFDEIYCCGLPAAKWLANKNPTDDWQNVSSLMSVLVTVTTAKFILISTIDVYDEEQLRSGTANELAPLQEERLHPYGRHRLLFEKFIQTSFSNSLIVRLPALFGFGLKKNAIYDLLNNNQVGNLCPDSQFQFYHLRNLARDIQQKFDVTQECGLQAINFFSEPISLRTIVDRFFPQFVISGDVIHLSTETPQIRQTPCQPQFYNVKTCYTQRYWLSKTEILQELELYLATHFRSQVPNLVVSNIAWNSEENEQALQLLRSHGVQNIEVAPTKLCTWQELDSFDADSYLSNLDRLGLKVDSAQAVTFGLPELQLFGTESSRHELFEHLCRVIVFVAKLKANLIVFGSPKNRSILGRMISSEADSVAIEFFSNLGDFAAQYSVCFCIEPNAKQYGCDFCTGAEEAAALVRRVNKPNFRLHFDTGCSEMEKEDCEVLTRVDSVLNHVHVSRPSLEAFSLNDWRIHRQWSKSLETINYSGKICIELAGKSEQLNLSNLNDALLIVRAAYRNNLL